MTAVSAVGRAEDGPRWQPSIDPGRYDTTPMLRHAEKNAITELGVDNLRRLSRHDRAAGGWKQIRRLLRPLNDASAAVQVPQTPHRRRAMLDATAVVLLHCAQTGKSFWSWTDAEWAGLLGTDLHEFRSAVPGWADDAVRPYLAAHAFLLGGFAAFYRLGSFGRLALAWNVFGRDLVDGEIGRIRSVLAGWGYQLGRAEDQLLPTVACQVLLLNRSPHLEDLNTELFEWIRRERLLPAARGNTLHAMQRAVAALGFCDPPQQLTGRHSARASGGAPEWAALVGRWFDTSTLTPRVRGSVRSILLRVGRWLEAEHPETADPADWTRQTCATWIAALDRMKVGDYVQRTAGLSDRLGKPLEAPTKAGQIAAVRRFFRDCQEWEWLPRHFDPNRALATPRSIAALLGPDPRVIADDIWAKLMWAGLNLTSDDLPQSQAGTFYPMELVRAVTLTWLSPGNAATRSRACASAASAGSTMEHRFPVTLNRFWPATRSACSTSQLTRPAPRSPNRSIRSSARPSTPGRQSGPTSRHSSTAAPGNRSICCSLSAPAGCRRATSTTP